MMMCKVFLSRYISKTLCLIIGLLQLTNGGLLDAVGILGNTLQTGAHGNTVPSLLDQIVGSNQGNMAKIPNQMHPQQQVTMQPRPNANNYYTTAPLSNQHVYPTPNYVNNVQRPTVAIQQRPINMQHQNAPNNGYNPQNAGQMVFIPHNTAQNYQQSKYPTVENQNQLHYQNLGQNGLQITAGQNNMQQMSNGNLSNRPLNQNMLLNGRPTSNDGQFGDQNQVYNEQHGLSSAQQFQQPTINGNYGGSLPPISSVIKPANTGNINHYNYGAQGSGHRNDGGIKDNGHRSESHKPTHKDDEDNKVHSPTVHKVFFQAKPLIVDDIAKDDRDITLYYQD